MKKYIALVLILSIVFLLTSNAVAEEISIENSKDSIERAYEKDEKISMEYSLEDDFDEDSVLVVLRNADSKYGRQYSVENFQTIECSEVKDLTIFTSDLLREQKAVFESIFSSGTEDHSLSLCIQTKLEEIKRKLEIVNINEFRQILKITLKTPGKQNVLNTIKALEQYPEVQYAQPNFIIKGAAVIPNDQKFSEQWAIDSINLSEAWEITTGNDEITVGIIDSGVDYNHPELSEIITSQVNFVETEGVKDGNGHGTHVAGIIGAAPNNETGVVGVNWNVNIKSIKILDENLNGNTGDLIDAIERFKSQQVKLINYSGGGYHRSDANSVGAERAVIDGYNGLFVFSAGNRVDNDDDESTPNVSVDLDNGNSLKKYYPACFELENVISVGAHDRNNNWHYNWGQNSVDLAAPGIGILSTVLVENGSYGTLSGTSFAAPYVTAVASLIMSLPNNNFTPAQVKSFILNGTDPVSGFEDKCVTGGKLNAYRAVRNALEMGNSTTVAGDFDGDGVDELAGFFGRNNYSVLIYWENTANKLDIQAGIVGCTMTWFPISQIEGQVVAGDFDGDGIDEIAVLYDYNTYLGYFIFEMQSNGKFSMRKLGDTGGFEDESIRNRVTSGDIDNDGTDELLALYDYAGQMGLWVFRITDTGSFTYTLYGRTGTLNPDFIDNRVVAGDFDGDGYDEVGILYDNVTNTTGMILIDCSTPASFYSYFLGQVEGFDHGNMKGLISAGDYDGDGTDEIMGLYGYDLNTSYANMRMWMFEAANGGFSYTRSDVVNYFYTPNIAYTMVTGKFDSATGRDTMAGIYQYGTYCKVWAFGYPAVNTWTCVPLC